MMDDNMSLDFNMQIGCCVDCNKYCPQDLIIEKHKGMKKLTLGKFKEFLSTVPTSVGITFSGASEPFLNSETPDMIMYADTLGYKCSVYTTLTGLSLDDAKKISKVPYERFTIHMPDAERNSKIDMTPQYFEVMKEIVSNVKNIVYMSMNGMFQTVHCEDMAYGKMPLKRGRVSCSNLEHPRLMVNPDGSVFFCVMTRTLDGYIGSLQDSTYQEISTTAFKSFANRMRKEPDSICHQCPLSVSEIHASIVSIKKKIMGIDCKPDESIYTIDGEFI